MRKPILMFDLDNTILDFDSGERAALTEAFKAMGIEPTEKLLSDYHDINIRYWERLETGELTRIEVLEGRFDELFRLYGIDCTGKIIQSIYENSLKKHYDFMPGAQALLEKIYEKNDLYIVSNGCADIQKARVEGAGLKKYFKEFFVSENLGYDKPDKRFFDCCIEKIPDFTPDRAVVIGDSLTSDIKGGMNAGLRTCWLNLKNMPCPENVKPDVMIGSLDEFIEKMKEWIDY